MNLHYNTNLVMVHTFVIASKSHRQMHIDIQVLKLLL